MSEDLYAMVDMTKKVRHKGERDKRIEERGDWEERLVDIYVSAASLRGHDPGLGTQQAVIQDIGGGQHGEKSQCRALALWLGLLCLLLLAGFIGLAIHRANCSKGEWNIGSSCYFISTEQKNWEESRQACADRQSHLMIINSKDEQDILNILNRSVWIGLTDREQEGTWKWVDGTSLTTQFWYPPQPDNSGQGEDCVEFHNENLPSRGWNDNSCHNVNYWICERAIC
uniref:C-type lectin domain family 4 member M-like isoform X4 n=1 Tax=Centroberyx gerrardi TaxID=166262 RepID=UPI003AAAF204